MASSFTDPFLLQSAEHPLDGLALEIVGGSEWWTFQKSRKESETGKPFIKVEWIFFHGGDFIRKILKQGAAVILSTGYHVRFGKPVENFSLDKCHSAAERFRYDICIREDGEHPSDDAPIAVSIHVVRVGRTALFFKDSSVDPALNCDPDKQIKLMMVALPQFIDKERLFLECEVATLFHLRTSSRQ